MADVNALRMLMELEQRREDKLAREFAGAQQQLQLHLDKLAGLEQYRIDYLRQLQQRGSGGINSQHYGHYHAFLGKLDHGIQQLHGSLVNVRNAVEQRRQRWLFQRQKKQAVQHLIDQRAKRETVKQNRREQRELDEFASNQRVRAQLANR